MLIEITDSSGKTHQIDPQEVIELRGGRIVFDPNAQADAEGFRSGNVVGSSVTLRNGATIDLDPLSYGTLFRALFGTMRT